MIEINAALGDPWDQLGDQIVKAGFEDSSGLRRMIVQWLADGKIERAAHLLQISEGEAQTLQAHFN